MHLENCPECDNTPRCWWKEIYIRDILPDGEIHLIPYQQYIAECSNLLCNVCVSTVFPYRSPQVEKSVISSWNELPKTFIEQK